MWEAPIARRCETSTTTDEKRGAGACAAARLHLLPELVQGRQAVLRRERRQPRRLGDEEHVWDHVETLDPRLRHDAERAFEGRGGGDFHGEEGEPEVPGRDL